jgi:VWFA-related protein
MKIAWIAAALLALVPRQQVFRSGVDVVSVDVLVTDGRKPIGGLTIADFEVRDEGVVQTIEHADIREVPFSMLLMLDTSASVAGKPLADLKRAAHAAVDALGPHDRAALITFSDALRPRARWIEPGAALDSAIDNAAAGGSTSLFDATFLAFSTRDPEPGRRSLLLLFTDGVDTTSWLPASAAYDRASRSGTVLYAVTLEGGRNDPRRLYSRSGITLDPGAQVIPQERFLVELARRTGGDLLPARDSGALKDTFERVVREFRTRYLLTYRPTGVPRSGWHKIEVKVKRPGVKVSARRGYER